MRSPQLDRELTQDLPKEIQRAREHGDLRENAEYHAAKERQRFVEARVSMLRTRVAEIQMMDLERIPKDRAGFGSRLTIRENGAEFTYELVMPEDSDPDRGIDFGRVADRAGVRRQGRGRRGRGAHAGRRPALRDSQARHHPRRRSIVTDASYSPRLRTAVLLCGTGTAGVYQAGVLRALSEAGVKIDVVAGHGPGAANALCAAIDGGSRLWDRSGPWHERGLATRVSMARRPAAGGAGLALAVALLLSPLLILVVAGGFYVASLLAGLLSMPKRRPGSMGVYRATDSRSCSVRRSCRRSCRAPWCWRCSSSSACSWWRPCARRCSEQSRRRLGGAFWWRLLGAPLAAEEPGATLTTRCGSWCGRVGGPDAGARRNRAGGTWTCSRTTSASRAFARCWSPSTTWTRAAIWSAPWSLRAAGARVSTTSAAAGAARGGDRGLLRPQRDLVVDFLTGALRLPVATAPWPFGSRPTATGAASCITCATGRNLAARLLDEARRVGVEQVILVSPAPPPAAPHALRPRPGSLRAANRRARAFR